MSIKILLSKDSEGACKIAKSLPDYFTDSALAEIERASANELLFMAFESHKPIGFLTVRRANKDVAELTWIGVLKEYQGKGIGTNLLNYAVGYLENDVKLLYGKTLADTAKDEGYSKTRSFWFKNQFIPLETIDPYPGWDEGNPCLIIVRPI